LKDDRFVLNQSEELNVYSPSLLNQQSADRHVVPLRHIIPSQSVFDLTP